MENAATDLPEQRMIAILSCSGRGRVFKELSSVVPIGNRQILKTEIYIEEPNYTELQIPRFKGSGQGVRAFPGEGALKKIYGVFANWLCDSDTDHGGWDKKRSARENRNIYCAVKDTSSPTPTLADNFTQVLPDGQVTFRLLAPNARVVELVIGVQCGPYEPQGGKTVTMTKDAKGLWSVTLGPLEPNLYEYQFNLDGAKFRTQATTCPSHGDRSTQACC